MLIAWKELAVFTLISLAIVLTIPYVFDSSATQDFEKKLAEANEKKRQESKTPLQRKISLDGVEVNCSNLELSECKAKLNEIISSMESGEN